MVQIGYNFFKDIFYLLAFMRKFLILLFFCLSKVIFAETLPSINHLDIELQGSIKSTCYSAKYESDTKYISCFKKQLSTLQGQTKLPAIQHLDEKLGASIKRACYSTKFSGPASFIDCYKGQLQDLKGQVKLPSIINLSDGLQDSLKSSCYSSQFEGPISLINCYKDQLRQLNGRKSLPSVKDLSQEEIQSLEYSCYSYKFEGPSSYLSCYETELSNVIDKKEIGISFDKKEIGTSFESKNDYVSAIAAKVKSNWRYSGKEDASSCNVYVKQDKNGRVETVNIQNCEINGDTNIKSLKNSIVTAVYKASPLPIGTNRGFFDREIMFRLSVGGEYKPDLIDSETSDQNFDSSSIEVNIQSEADRAFETLQDSQLRQKELQLESLQKDFDEQQKNLNNLKKFYQQKIAENESAHESDIKEYSDQIKIKDEELAELNILLKGLQTKLSVKTSNTNNQKAVFAELESQIKMIEKRRLEEQLKLESIAQSISNLNDQKKALNDQKETLEIVIQEFESQATEAAKKKLNKDEELKDINAQIIKAKNTLARYQTNENKFKSIADSDQLMLGLKIIIGFLFVLLLISFKSRKKLSNENVPNHFINNDEAAQDGPSYKDMVEGANKKSVEDASSNKDKEEGAIKEASEDGPIYKDMVEGANNESSIEEPKIEEEDNRLKYLKLVEIDKWTQEWNKWISAGISSFDASAIMNLNRYKTSKKLIKDKKDKNNIYSAIQLEELSELEKLALKAYRAKTRRTRLKYFSFEDEEYTGLISTIIMTQDYQYALEIKVDESNYWQAKSGFIPQTIMCELQHQMMLTGLKQIDYWCFLKGYDGILIKVDRNDSFINDLLESENKIYSKIHN